MAKQSNKPVKPKAEKTTETGTIQKTTKDIEDVLSKKEAEIEKAEKTIRHLETIEEKFEIKELLSSIDDIESICNLPSEKMKRFANETISVFDKEIGIDSNNPRKNRLQKYFDLAIWGKAPTSIEVSELKSFLSEDIGSSIFNIFSNAEIDHLSSEEVYNSKGIQIESVTRKAILDWNLAIQKQEHKTINAKDVLVTDIRHLIHGEDIYHRKTEKKYDCVPHHQLFYKNAEEVSKGIQKYCYKVQKANDKLAEEYNKLFKTLSNTWTSTALNEATAINDKTKTSNKQWSNILSLVKQLEKKQL